MKIKYAVLNSQVFHPVTGRLQGTLIAETYRGIQMALTGNGVRIEHKGATLLVPLHKFDFVELEGKEPKEDIDVKEAAPARKRLF